MCAVTNPRAVVFRHNRVSDLRQIPTSELSMESIRQCLLWCNDAIKRPHIQQNCFVRGADGPMADVMRHLGDMTQLHPSAVTPSTRLATVECATSEASSSGCVAAETILTPADQEDVGVCAWRLAITEGMLTVPFPSCTASGAHANVTVMFLGLEMKDVFLHTSTAARPREEGGEAAPRWFADNRVDPAEGCRIMYMAPVPAMLPRGMNSQFFFRGDADMFQGRLHVGLCGAKCLDMTARRMLIFSEVNESTVPLICGCGLRDSRRFERAHIPFIMMPYSGSLYLFTDNEDGTVAVHVDNRLWGNVDTTKRHKFKGVWWLEGST
jgi:hypothetical protein